MGEGAGLGVRAAPVRRLRRLIEKRAEREREGALVVEGPRALEAAFAAGAAVDAVYVDPEASVAAPVIDVAADRGVPVHRLAPGVAARVGDTVTPQGVFAVVAMPRHDLADVDLSLSVVLVDVRDPGNVGTLLRTAEAAGATAVVSCRGSADVMSPKVVRASAGAVFHVAVVQAGEAGEVLDVLAQQGVRRMGTAVGRGVAYDDADWSPPAALVLGNEGWGLPDHLHDRIDAWVHVPMAGRAESLNVAAAGAVLLFEARRRGAR